MSGSIEMTLILKLCEAEGLCLYRLKGINKSYSKLSSWI